MKIKKNKKAKILRDSPKLEKKEKGLSVSEITLFGIMFVIMSFGLFPLLQPQNPELRSETRLVAIEDMRQARKARVLEMNPVWVAPVPVQIWQNQDPVKSAEIKLPDF